MPKLTADWGKTGEKWLPKGCFQGLQNVKNYREKAEKTAEIPKYYALFALMWEKYEKSHEKISVFHFYTFQRQESTCSRKNV